MRISTTVAVCLLTVLPPFAVNAEAGGGKQKIERILRSPAAAATHVGVKAVALPSGKTLVAVNSGKLFIPASTAKLVTAYSAFKTLTPGYVFRTEFATDAFIDPVTVRNVYISGYGDPSATLADLALQALAVADRCSAVTGDIIVDTAYFDALRFGRGWMWDEGLAPWNAPIAPYNVQGNAIDIHVRPGKRPGDPVETRTVPRTAYAVIIASATTGDCNDIAIAREETPSGDRFIVTGTLSANAPEKKWSCTVSRPGLYAGTLFKEILARSGVTVSGTVYEAPAPTGTVTLATSHSRPLAQIVRAFLKESDNLMGECILKTMGAEKFGAPGTAENGVRAMHEVMRGVGIPDNTYRLVDGSGLSTYNQLSPDILTELLRAAWRDFAVSPEFIEALSVAGFDGTLKNRLNGGTLAGYVRAKTGSMSGVSCISGYLQTRRGTLLAVSIMMNGFTGPASSLKTAQDEILQTLWEEF